MVSVAEFDAVNAATGGYVPYALNISAPGASPEAAAAQAAYTVLTNISQANIANLHAALAASLNSIPDGPAKEDGIRVGRLAANLIIQLRAADNPNLAVPPPVPSSAPGAWRPTPPSFSAAFGMQGRFLTPWTMRTAAQFRPGPPPSLTSELYVRDYNEIREVGSRSFTNRTPAQTDSAVIRERDDENYILEIFAKKPLPLVESARRSALMFMAAMDAVIQAFDSKYAYNFWRPITAIRAGASDGNDLTVGDTAWTPYLETHNHPDYPSLLVATTSALINVMISIHGDDVEFDAVSQNGAKTRHFQKLSAYIDDAITARVIGGTHFRNSCDVAAEMGRQIALNAVECYLRPLPSVQSGIRTAGEFQLSLTPGRTFPYVIQTSSDLLQWRPWITNIYGVVIQTDTNAAAADRRFYRTVITDR